MIILTTIYVVAAVLVLFGAAIFVHEFGHFWVARKLGMKVEEFAIGFGPKIYSWKRDGIEYSMRWIPAGGFVKLPQMVTSETLEGQTTVNVPPAPPLHKILVAFAGPFMNVVFAFAIAASFISSACPCRSIRPSSAKSIPLRRRPNWGFMKATGSSWWITSRSSPGRMSWNSRWWRAPT